MECTTGLGHEMVVRRASPSGRRALRPVPQDQWLALLGRYWQAVREGWWRDVPRSDWVGPHHPFKNDDPAR
jgi:hypothetical protein